MSTTAPTALTPPAAPDGTGSGSGRLGRAAVAALVSLPLVALGVAPQLSARLTGDEVVLRVAPLDPVDPFRGAYVTLGYPDLPTQEASLPGTDGTAADGRPRPVYAVLEQRPAADGAPTTWGLARWSEERPEDGVFLACTAQWGSADCGIDSWFVPQDEAQRLERALADTGALATVRVDARGNAAVVGLDAP